MFDSELVNMIQSAIGDTTDKEQSKSVVDRYVRYAKTMYSIEDKDMAELFDCVWGLASFSDEALVESFPHHFSGEQNGI